MAGTRSITRRARQALAAALALALLPAAAQAHVPRGEPGAPGIGDPYFPLAGNGGYDVARYDLDVAIDPVAKTLVGHAVVSARATQALSRFDLDLVGLTVRSVRVDGRAAAWTRDGGELVITPRHVLPRGDRFSVDVRYDGAPTTADSGAGAGGALPTSDGLMIIGEPDVAATWFPVNDHPADKARYAIDVTVPAGYQAVSNGRLVARSAHGGRTTYRWREDGPMASYLATATVGRFQTRRTARTGCASTTRSTRPSSPRSRRRRPDRSSSSPATRIPRTSGSCGRSPSRPAAPPCPSTSRATPSASGTSSSSRRTRSAATRGRRCPTPTATRRTTPASRARSAAGRRSTPSSPTTRPTTPTAAARPSARPAPGRPRPAATTHGSAGRST